MSIDLENEQLETIEKTGLNQYANGQSIHRVAIPVYEIMYRENTGFGMYLCEDEENYSFLIKGEFVSPLIVGQTYFIQGTITSYQGKKQILVKEIHHTKPTNRKGIISYLQTLKGLKTKAELIYDQFGEKSIDFLLEDPMKVANSIHGIGKKSVLSWQEQLEKMKDSQVIISQLLGYGLSIRQARKLYEKYKDTIVSKVESNPYFLAREVRGYGFERCDRIAKSIGFDPKSPFRIRAGILHLLQEASYEGHTYLPIEELIKRAVLLLNVRLTYQEMKTMASSITEKEMIPYFIGTTRYDIDPEKLLNSINAYELATYMKQKETHRYTVISFDGNTILQQISSLIQQFLLIKDEERVYLKELYEAEEKVAILASELALTTPFLDSIDINDELTKYLTSHQVSLEDKQREAVLTFAKDRGGFYILNGSAGCGKTFTLKIILSLLKIQYMKNDHRFIVKVFAPTGKASKVATKATGIECITVHRGLGYRPQSGFLYNENNRLDVDVLVVDESSMLDIELTMNLLKSLPMGTKVIFMGDTKQLPSVGAGNVLHDLILSNVINVVTLDVVKRQGALSGIIQNANRIISGNMIVTQETTQDAYVLYRETPESIQKTIIQSIERLLKRDEYQMDDIQVLTPQRTGLVGTYYLNYLLQEYFNQGNEEQKILNHKFQITRDPKKGVEILSLFFKKGDKVIHTQNNYDMEWYRRSELGDYLPYPDLVGITNGECGVIENILFFKNTKGDLTQRIIVRYDNHLYVFYDDSFEELDHAYAMTIHKSQGSQWKAVILPITKQHYMMLDNNLLYTGYTRAESFNVVIGNKEAINRAIQTFRSIDRYTHLADRLKSA